MIASLEHAFWKLRIRLNRSEWLARLFRLPVSADTGNEPGLVLVQIDGLSYTELERALNRREMPFLKRLLEREHYELKRVYAGVPATTAAAQAELFYGVEQAVPGYSFRDKESGELVRMIQQKTAARVERDLESESRRPLLSGGSAYSDNYTGGAAEPHFCPAARGWGSAMREASPLSVAVLLFSNAFSFLRALALVGLELVIAVGDLARGIVDGQDFVKELKFIPTRVAITILLRELVVIGARIDIARGLPIIHLNLLGYDEQSHRRGPDSAFAHWTLRGIDNAIKRLWKATHLSSRRVFDLWIHSDHGQESVTPYLKMHDKPFAQAVAEVFAEHLGTEMEYQADGPWGAELHRAGQLGDRMSRWVSQWLNGVPADQPQGPLQISTLGPVAMIYWDEEMTVAEKTELAKKLVADAHVPVILFQDDAQGVIGWTATGALRLPEDAERLLGSDHPFWQPAGLDLARLCRQPNAGMFVACGTVDRNTEPLTFAMENGAHGGAGRHETSAFAIVPRETGLSAEVDQPLRLADLRHFALQARGQASPRVVGPGPGERTLSRTLRIVTYNVHSCIGMDGRLSPERIARVIARCEADVVCLQELDMARQRTLGVDQAHRIAEVLDMDFFFHPALQIEEERYGDAVLTNLPMRRVKAGALPGWRPQLEPRGVLWVEIELGEMRIQVLNTHFGLRGRERNLQLKTLLGSEWLGHPDCHQPRILCGDFNALPGSLVHRHLRRTFKDVQLGRPQRPKATFSGRFPSARIDHVFVDPDIEVRLVEVPNSELNRVASDHLPLIVELDLPSGETAL